MSPDAPAVCWRYHLTTLSSCRSRGLPGETRAPATVRWRGTMRKLAVRGVLQHAAKGAVQEVLAAKGLYDRLCVALSISAICIQEVKGLLGALPAAMYALYLHASLRGVMLGKGVLVDVDTAKPGLPALVARNCKALVLKLASYILRSQFNSYKASVIRDVRFGDAERNVLDVYVPSGHTPKCSRPVVIFVHGGIWAMGDKWQFSSVGACLADRGVLAVLVQYSLYPEVLACEQVKEVSRALSWTLDNILDYGGDPCKVFLMGHSAGAHLSALVLWERANLGSGQGDGRQPHCFIGLAGVYDIGEHYKYETSRGVAALSCMRRVMGGRGRFEAMSPAILFRSLHQPSSPGKANTQAHVMPPCYLYASHSDTVVPAESSKAFRKVLVDVGCNSCVVFHDSLLHDDFAFWDKGWLSLSRCGPLVEDILAVMFKNDSGGPVMRDGVQEAQGLQYSLPTTSPYGKPNA